MTIEFDKLTHDELEVLADDCEDFLLHRNIPLFSHSYQNIVSQALKEGYKIDKFDRVIPKHLRS